ncbi:hypothetical protein AXG93_2646s1130 [Marchantia polymorpha subsp. ruderalis]|uniref:Uncharacterized protein n=1 Tax=Marchantia polymorpha subsp. ruderalis TaxID=1480154 RepID=A0A176W617_MARPO|nr:hypothetical protein AXG93_2646s1130 [Marchantia polymorpha subsp. ruderalis]
MKSADEESELPSAVQDLLRRLEGKGEPITSLPDLTRVEFRDFFPESASLSMIIGWRSQVRLQVLEAIGSCDTFKLSARCFLNLVSGLRGNSDSKLQSLELWDAWEHCDAQKHVADMINSATRLETLTLGYLVGMDEETVGILSQALIQSSSLTELKLLNVDEGAALLLKALAGDNGNRSIERLGLARMDGLGDCLRQLLTSNPSLKEVTLDSLRMRPEEWHQLGELIRDKARATNIGVQFGTVSCVRDEWESIEALECAASSDFQDPTLELHLTSGSEHELMLSLNLLGRVLRGEIISLKSLDIWATPPHVTSSTNQDIVESMERNGKTGETSTLKELTVHVGLKDIWNGVWKGLLWYLRGNTSLTHLDLSGNKLDVQGPDGSLASELGSPGNRCLSNLMENGEKGGVDSRVSNPEPEAGSLHVRVPRSQIRI